MATTYKHSRMFGCALTSRSLRLVTTVVALGMLLVGCFSLLPPLHDHSPPLPDSAATLLVTVHATDILSVADGFRPPERLRVTLEKPRSSSTRTPTLRREATVHANPVTVSFEQIETGHWTITAELVDEEGMPMYQGADEVHVRDGETAIVHIALDALPGQLEVLIDLGERCVEIGDEGQCLADIANRGHIRLAPGPDGKAWNENFEWNPGDQVGTASVKRLAPGDYEFQLVFYRDSRTVGNTLYASYWEPFRIEPNKTTTVEWHIQAGALTVHVHVNGPPSPPSDLSASWTDDGVLLSWSPSSSDNITHYNVWYRTGPKVELTRIHTTADASSTTWLDEQAAVEHCSGPVDDGLYYFVTAVNEYGLESLRSDVVNACTLL